MGLKKKERIRESSIAVRKRAVPEKLPRTYEPATLIIERNQSLKHNVKFVRVYEMIGRVSNYSTRKH